MELNTAELGDFVRLAGIILEKEKESLGMEARQSGLFIEEPISLNTGNTREYTEIDSEEYAKKKRESNQATRQNSIKNMIKEKHKNKEIKLIIQETEEEVDFGDFVNEVINFEEPAKKESEK